ncbi:MAG: phosphoribosylformylglycinamidine synthase subunit PurQ [Vicingaceae bacterium]
MKFGVVTFPGSNCDEDMIYVLQHIMGQKVAKLWHKDHDLQSCDFIVLPGGFSYGDYLRSGAIARFSPIMEEVVKHAKRGGYVMGICNGFQILCEASLVPGTLLHNDNQKFICENVHLRVETNQSPITANCKKGQVLKIPIAHAEGRYYIGAAGLEDLNGGDQVLFRYCDEKGRIDQSVNPNGSLDNIAGVCNAERNVFGMMPHPERAADPELKNTDGRILFESMLTNISNLV